MSQKKVLNEVLERELSYQKKILDYYADCTQIKEEFRKKYIKTVGEYLDYYTLADEYVSTCILGLGEVKENSKTAILDKIYEIDDRINELTLRTLEKAVEALKKDVAACLNDLGAIREERLISAVEEFDVQLAGTLRSTVSEIGKEAAGFEEQMKELYSFFDPEGLANNRYCLRSREIQNTYQFTLSDVRHCDYIVFMKELTQQYGLKVIEFFGDYRDRLAGYIDKVETEDRSFQTQLFNLAEQVVKGCRTDILVNEKMYGNYKEEMAELGNYSEETIKNLQEESK